MIAPDRMFALDYSIACAYLYVFTVIHTTLVVISRKVGSMILQNFTTWKMPF
jgi:hypothetical protein